MTRSVGRVAQPVPQWILTDFEPYDPSLEPTVQAYVSNMATHSKLKYVYIYRHRFTLISATRLFMQAAVKLKVTVTLQIRHTSSHYHVYFQYISLCITQQVIVRRFCDY